MNREAISWLVKFATGRDSCISVLYTGAGMTKKLVSVSACTCMSNCTLLRMQAAENRQILCVTHLAQIAAMADTQLLIKKTSDEKRTYTGITKLDFEGRKREIARIISGDENDPISLENAEMLLLRKNVI